MTEDSKFHIPEKTSSMGAGFLTEFWKLDTPLPRISGIGLFTHYVQRGVHTLLSLPMNNAITIITITLSIFLFSGFLLVIQNVDRVISELGNTLYVTAYVNNESTDKEVAAFVAELESSPLIRSVRFTSKEEAFELFRKDLGSRSSFLQGLEEESPLPASIDLVLQPDELKIGSTESIVTKLKKNPLLEEVIFGSEWVEKMQGILKVFRLCGYGALFVVLCIIVFLISNTIRLVIFARKGEIEIMKLVGATDGFVKIPFVIGGVLQGVVGAFAGVLCLKVVFWFLMLEVKYSTLFGIALPKFMFLSPAVLLMIVLLGLTVGAVGSFFALGRLTDV